MRYPLTPNPSAAALAAPLIAGLLLCVAPAPGMAQSAPTPKTAAQAKPQPAAKPATPAKPRAPAKKPRRVATPAPPPAPLPLVLPVAEGEQLAATAMVHFGDYACEFKQTVHIGLTPGNDGYIDVKFGLSTFTMRPVLSTTGALRLEDMRGEALMIQIAFKSMMMNVQTGRRMVDDCVHPKQEEARKMYESGPQMAGFGIAPGSAGAGSTDAPAAPAVPAVAASAPAPTAAPAGASAPEPAPAMAPTPAPTPAPEPAAPPAPAPTGSN